jgi:hypothetical protein
MRNSKSRLAALFAVTGLAVALIPTASRAAPETSRRSASDFHEIAEVVADAPLSQGRAYAVPLSREAIAALRDGGELRVFDAAGAEIPSLVYTAHAREESVRQPVSIFNRAFEPGLLQTLSVEIEDRTLLEVNEFTFDIEDPQYNVRVKVEGSDDASAWRIIQDDLHLIRHTVPDEKIRYVHNVLRIPTSRFRYFRFTLRALGREQPLEIESITVRKVEPRGASLHVPVRIERWGNPRDSDSRHEYWKLHLPFPDLGVDRVLLTMDGRDFARSASLWEWNVELGRPTEPLASSVFFHYGQDLKTGFEGFSTDADVLVVMIDQGDDAPVPVKRARASRPAKQLRFLLDDPVTEPLRLHFLPDEARTPKYDLDRRLKEHGVTDFTRLNHGALAANPAYAEPGVPWTEQVPYLLYALVIALVAALALYIARTVRAGLPPEEPGPDA